MSNSILSPGILSSRLKEEEYEKNFSDAYPGYSNYEAKVEADRCYFCYDAPCITACPTEINIPLFIRQISTGMENEAAKTIFNQNILGGMCARVCPTETLCEEACVREASEGKPVKIGRLQRFATDSLMEKDNHPFTRSETLNMKVVVVGSGPAGLSCAHRLALHGYDVDVMESSEKAGGLNEFGIATYKSVDDFAAREVEWLVKIGGITLKVGKQLGVDFSIDELLSSYDAVFIGCGLSDTNKLNFESDLPKSTEDAVDFISDLRQVDDFSSMPIGRNIIVIGGGMTAIDAAVQSRLLGAETVTIVYRRGLDAMGASSKERDNATSKGVKIICNAMPIDLQSKEGLSELTLAYSETDPQDGKLRKLDQTFTLQADQIFCAIGQKLSAMETTFKANRGKIEVDDKGRTSIKGIWAGGDCVDLGEDLTVSAVAQGRDAAENIHETLMSKKGDPK